MTAIPGGLLFCDVCGESVPTRDIERGAARRHGNRVLCAFHAGAIAKAAETQPTWPFYILIVVPILVVVSLCLSAAALFGVWRQPGRDDLSRVAEESRAGVSALAERVSSAEASAGAAAKAAAAGRNEAAERLEAVIPRLDALGARAEALATRVGDLEATIASVQAASSEAAAALRAAVEPLRADVDALRSEVAAERDARARAAAAPPPEIAEAAQATAEIESFRRRLVGADAASRFSALVELGKRLGPAAAPDVAIALSDADPFIRAFAARLLGDFRLRETVPDLVIALRDADPEVRRAALPSLRAIAGSDFGYDPDAAADDRSGAIRRVEEWFRADARAR